MPGTMGTLATLPLALLLAYLWPFWGLLVVGVALFFVGWLLSALHLPDAASKDPKYIVIDESAGVLLALLPAGLDWRLWVVGVIAFRIFDISKVWPICWAEEAVSGTHTKNAFSLMFDDILAGLFSAAIVYGVAYLLV